MNNEWCPVCVLNSVECECNAKPKTRKETSKSKFKIHTLTGGKFQLEREEGFLLQENIETSSDSSKQVAKSKPGPLEPEVFC